MQSFIPMGIRVTAWRLTHPMSGAARCVISERDGRWHLIVQQGRVVTLAERCSSDDEALERANRIWSAMKGQGWTEPTH